MTALFCCSKNSPGKSQTPPPWMDPSLKRRCVLRVGLSFLLWTSHDLVACWASVAEWGISVRRGSSLGEGVMTDSFPSLLCHEYSRLWRRMSSPPSATRRTTTGCLVGGRRWACTPSVHMEQTWVWMVWHHQHATNKRTLSHGSSSRCWHRKRILPFCQKWPHVHVCTQARVLISHYPSEWMTEKK